MNLLSLPDEMLASVLKYSNFKDLTVLRKLSSNIDFVAGKYGLDKIKVHTMTVIFYKNRMEMTISCKQPRSYQLHYPGTLAEMMEYYFKKVRAIRMLVIANEMEEREIIISEDVGKLLLTKICKNVIFFNIRKCKLAIGFKLLRSILTNMKLKELLLYSFSLEIENADKLIEGLTLDTLTLKGPHQNASVSLSSLDEMCARKIPSELICKLYNTTLSELGEFFEKLPVNWKKNKLFWSLETDKGTMKVEDIDPYLRRLECFKDCKIETFDYQQLIPQFDFAIRFQYNISIYLCVRF